jgi:hypothetical protein
MLSKLDDTLKQIPEIIGAVCLSAGYLNALIGSDEGIEYATEFFWLVGYFAMIYYMNENDFPRHRYQLQVALCIMCLASLSGIHFVSS